MKRGDLAVRIASGCDDTLDAFYVFVEHHHETDSWGWFLDDGGLSLHDLEDFEVVSSIDSNVS